MGDLLVCCCNEFCCNTVVVVTSSVVTLLLKQRVLLCNCCCITVVEASSFTDVNEFCLCMSSVVGVTMCCCDRRSSSVRGVDEIVSHLKSRTIASLVNEQNIPGLGGNVT